MSSLLSTLSYYSLRRGVLSPERICRIAKTLGYDVVALTDRDNLYGLPEFLYQARRYGLRPIIGAELTDPRTSSSALIYAHGHEGFANLCRVISERHCDRQFRLTGSIAKDPNGLRVVSDDLALLEWLHGRASCFYRLRRPVRIPRRITDPDIVSLVIPEMAFAASADYAVHRLLRAIDCKTSLSRLAEMECLPERARFQSWQAVRERFEVFGDALEATERFGQTVRSPEQFGTTIFPQAESACDTVTLLREKIYAGAKKRYPVVSDRIRERIEYELGVIERKGFASYFLIVEDIVKQSPRTCGRGSGAASIVAYCLGITNVDPIRYNLRFERFLSPGRTDPPDLDIDFAWDERDRVLDYVFDKYGTEHAAMVCTHGTFGMKAAVRETARVFGMTEAEISSVTGKMPEFYHGEGGTAIVDVLSCAAATRNIRLDPPWPEIVTHAQRILALPSVIGTHPGGVVITPGPINRHAPIQYSAKGYPIVQWEKDGAEEMGLVKIDVLGNRSLAVIRDAVANLRKEGVPFDESQWDPTADGSTIDLLARGRTMGVFYVESPAMRLLQERTKTGDFEHLVIHSSLIRPAANRHTREYIRRLHGGHWKSLHPLLAETLAETYGIMVYQEDVTRVAMQLAGFTVDEAEALRKVLAKKARHGTLEDYRWKFVNGARRNGVSPAAIEEIWDMMMAFGGYSFCKPHSASYCQVSFQSAWLKAHHPAAFLAAVISNGGGFYSTQAYVSEAQRWGLKVTPPDVNQSLEKCFSRGREIVIGLDHIKRVGLETVHAVVGERQKNGEYRTLETLIRRTGLTERDAEKLVAAGACDCLDPEANRPRLFWQLRSFFRSGSADSAPPLTPLSRIQLLAAQQQALGFLTETHPITLVRPRERGRAVLVREIRSLVGRTVSFYGWCVTSRTVTTEQGEGMQFVTFEDETGIVETVLFPDAYAKFTHYLGHQEAFLVWGTVTDDDGAVVVEVNGLRPVKIKHALHN